MSAKKKSIQTLAGHLLVFVQSLILIPIIIKVAGPETYGTYVLIISYMSIMFGISSMGVGINAKRWLPSTLGEGERAATFYPQFWFQILSVLSFAILSVTVYIIFFASLNQQLSGFLVWLVPAYLLAYTLYSQVTDYYRYTHRVGIFNISTVSQPYLFVFIAIGIFWNTEILNLNTLIASFTFSSILIGGSLFLLLYKEIGLQCSIPSHSDCAREIKVGFPLILAYLVDVILLAGDRYIISIILTLRDVGIYVPAYTLGSLVIVLPKVFGVVLPPLISQRIDAGDEAGAKRLSDIAVRIFLLLSIPYFVGSAVLGAEVLKLYATDEIANAAWPVVPIVSLASIFYGLILIKSNVLFVRLKTKSLLKINLVCMVLNIILNILLLKIFGNVVVAAVATLVSYVMSYLLINRMPIKDAIDFEIDKPWVYKILLCSSIMGVILIFMASIFPYEGAATIGFGVMAGSITYAILILMQASIRAELVFLAKRIKSR
jgi:O-antigen/teichoic acid export membrane protein